MRSGTSLRQTRDFQRVYTQGGKLATEAFTLYFAGREDPDLPARLGLAVRARSVNAVARNRIRRRLRAAFGRCGVTGLDVVIRADPAVATVSFQDLVEELCREVRRARGAVE